MLRSLRFLSAPGAVAREALADGRGVPLYLVLALVEYIVEQPRMWLGSAMRLRGAPLPALSLAFSGYGHTLLPLFVAYSFIGLARYWTGRARGWPRLDSSLAANAFAYTYLPHTLLVCSGAIAAAAGFDAAWLPQHSLADMPAGAARLTKLLCMFAPTLAYVALVWRGIAPVVPTAPGPQVASGAQRRSSNVVALAAGTLLCAGIGATFVHIAQHWRDYRPHALGEPMPPFVLQGIDRPGISSTEVAGAPLVIDFWATWCPPCIAALPHLQDIQKEYEPRGVRFLAVNIESDNRQGVESFVRAKHLTMPVYLDADGSMQEHFHVHMYPTTWLMGADGRIDTIYSGSVAPDELRAKIQKLLAP